MKESVHTINKGFYFKKGVSFLNQIAYGSFITIPNPPCPLVPQAASPCLAGGRAYVAGGSNSFQYKI